MKMKINDNYLNLSSNYLFADIAKRVRAFKAQSPKADVISLGIGDVTQPLCPAVVEALHKAADEMGTAATFHGYGPEQGYDFLRNAIVEHVFRARGMSIDADEIFVSDVRTRYRNSEGVDVTSRSPSSMVEAVVNARQHE